MAQKGIPLPENTGGNIVDKRGEKMCLCFPETGQIFKTKKWDKKIIITFSVSHQQHSVVDHPGVAENLQRVRYTLPVKLEGMK